MTYGIGLLKTLLKTKKDMNNNQLATKLQGILNCDMDHAILCVEQSMLMGTIKNLFEMVETEPDTFYNNRTEGIIDKGE